MSGFLLPSAPIRSLDEYLATDFGGLGVHRAQQIGAQGTVDEVARAGLRGRGGAGFPTGRKWAGVIAQGGGRRYLVCNAAEGEPATFKDRALLRANPYQLVEGVIIAAFAVGATESYICLKSSFTEEIAAVTRAVQEMQSAGICRNCPVNIVSGPDEYLYGEEKAMLEVIEGKPPLPRLLPPYEHGLFATAPQAGWQSVEPAEGPGEDATASNPTLVNNAETLSVVPHILARGADWFRTMGTPESPGTAVCTVVGDVERAGVAEFELGTPLRDIITTIGGGPRPGRRIKAVFSGVANAVITADQLGVPVTYEGFASIGSGMGAAGFYVLDDTACMVDTALQFSRFLAVESCGQCPPCKLGSAEITERLERIQSGAADERDIGEIAAWLAKVTDGARCFLASEEQIVVASIMRAFPEEFEAHIEFHRCPRPRTVPLPKIVDLRDGRAIYDERQARKRPDWTYAPG